MNDISFEKFLRESNYAKSGKRNLAGAIGDVKEFIDEIQEIKNDNREAFAFLAYYYSSDKYVREYVKEGALGSDAGDKIIVLYIDEPPISDIIPTKEHKDKASSVTLENIEPSYQLASRFFLDEAHPSLPGIIFLNELVSPNSSIYVSISNESLDNARSSLRKVLSLAQENLQKNGNFHIDFDKFSSQLIENGIKYKRAGEKDLRSAYFTMFAWLKLNAKAILVAAPKYVGIIKKQPE